MSTSRQAVPDERFTIYWASVVSLDKKSGG
jgi:hypothetical protein